ncbi:MAG TPA: hypothetical protein VGG01_09945, partial [Xanthobacteraceae bacterium]
MACAPLAAATAETSPPDSKTGTKTPAKHAEKKSAEKKSPEKKSREQKAENKSHDKKAESHDKKDDKRDKQGAKNDVKKGVKKDVKKDTKQDAKRDAKKSHADKKVTKVTTAPTEEPRMPVSHTRPGVTAPSRSVEFPVHRVTAHLEPPPAPITHPAPLSIGIPLAEAPTTSTPSSDVDAVRQAIGFARAGKAEAATSIERGISDPLARKLVEWVILRSDDNGADFARYNAFITANPGWPSIVTLRRRAEAMLWQERAPSATVRAYFAGTKPLSAKGH